MIVTFYGNEILVMVLIVIRPQNYAAARIAEAQVSSIDQLTVFKMRNPHPLKTSPNDPFPISSVAENLSLMVASPVSC